MNSELTLDEAKRLVQFRLDSWRTPEREYFISDVTPFEHGWVIHHDFWFFDHELKRRSSQFNGGFGRGRGPLAVMKTGEVYETPGIFGPEILCELLARNWEAAHAPALAVELSEEAHKPFVSIFNRLLRHTLHAGAVEARIEEDGRLRWRIGNNWNEQDGKPWFIGNLFARRLKEMADIDTTDTSEPEAMRSGLIKISMSDVRFKMAGDEPVKQDGKLVPEMRTAVYTISLSAFPTERGEQVIMVIVPDEATSTWGTGTTDSLDPS